MKKISPANTEEVLRFFKDNPKESVRQAVKVLRMHRKTIRIILKDNAVVTITQKKSLESKNLYEQQPYIDIRGIYSDPTIQIVLLATKGVEIFKEDIEKFIQTPIPDHLPVSYVSADNLKMAELITLLDKKWLDNINETKFTIGTQEKWLAELIVASQHTGNQLLEADPRREKLFALVSGPNSENLSFQDGSLAMKIKVDDMGGALSGIMLAPEISRLRASAFPTLAKTVNELRRSNVCSHSPLIIKTAIDLRLQCASKIKTDGLKIAEPHRAFHKSNTRKANITLKSIRLRERKKITKYKTEVSPFFPGKIVEPGARLLGADERVIPGDSGKFILNLESLRELLLSDFCLRSIQKAYCMAQKAQENFLDSKNNDPLIECANLLGPAPSWMSSTAELNEVLKILNSDSGFKKLLMSSLNLIAIDPTVFLFSLFKIKKYQKIIEKNETEYYNWLQNGLYIHGGSLAPLGEQESRNFYLSEKSKFISNEVSRFYPRAFELIMQHAQLSLLSTLEDNKMNYLVNEVKETCWKNHDYSLTNLEQFIQKVFQDLEPDKMRLCREFLKPWPVIVFDMKFARYSCKRYIKSAISGILQKDESKFKKTSYNSTGQPEEEGDSIEIGKLDDSLVDATGATQSYKDDIAQKSRDTRLNNILSDEAELLKNKKLLSERISMAEELDSSSPLRVPWIRYYKVLQTKNTSLYDAARMSLLDAMMKHIPEEPIE